MAEPLPAFVARRRPEWSALERLLDRQATGQLHLDDLSTLDRLYRRASADLALAQAFYVNTDAHRFLNQLCARAYGAIYRPRVDRAASLRAFFREGFPRAVRETLPYTLTSVALLALGVVLGATTVAIDPGGAKYLIDDSLRAFIDRRELWTDSALGMSTPGEMATMIFTNNLSVSFRAFAFGVSAGIGTVLLIILNGVHVGALVAACFQNGLGPGILTFMAAHGPVELSIICLCGGAGLVIGHAIIDPGERTRASWLKERSRVAVQLVLGSAPFLVLIGVVEGFVSPGAFFPWPLKVLLGAASGVGFWLYLLQSGRSASGR